MRQFLVACWLLSISCHVASLFLLPDRVALHFGMDGTPNGWGHPATHVAFNVTLQTLMLLLAISIPWLVRKTPRQLVNLPNRDYWLADERLDETISRLRDYCDELGILLQTFFIALGVSVAAANLSDPVRLDNRIFLPILAAFVISILVWIVRLFFAFRLPKGATTVPDE